MKNIMAIVSGGFDPVHIGHIRLFREAADLADKLLVIVNNDYWLRKKKGYAFMPEHDRVEIIKSIRYVDHVMLTSHLENPSDMSVCRELEMLAKDHSSENKLLFYKLIFYNGGDRKADNIPEYALCENLGIEMKFGIGGDKVRSSSDLVNAVRKQGLIWK